VSGVLHHRLSLIQGWEGKKREEKEEVGKGRKGKKGKRRKALSGKRSRFFLVMVFVINFLYSETASQVSIIARGGDSGGGEKKGRGGSGRRRTRRRRRRTKRPHLGFFVFVFGKKVSEREKRNQSLSKRKNVCGLQHRRRGTRKNKRAGGGGGGRRRRRRRMESRAFFTPPPKPSPLDPPFPAVMLAPHQRSSLATSSKKNAVERCF